MKIQPIGLFLEDAWGNHNCTDYMTLIDFSKRPYKSSSSALIEAIGIE